MSDAFSDLHIVITGGTGALGRAVVGRLLDAGAHCHVPVLDEKELEDFELRDADRLRLAVPVDLTEEAEVADFYAAVPELWASIHCAGGFAMAPFADTGFGVYEYQMALNATTCFLSCRAAVRRLRQRSQEPKGGRLVNVAARPALEPRSGAGMVAYTMSKAAVAALTQSLAQELADEGIWVNAVAPSILDTPANRAAMPEADFARWPKPDDIAATIVHLASPANRTCRGGLVPVYGAS